MKRVYEIGLKPSTWVVESDEELDPVKIKAKFFDKYVEIPQKDCGMFLEELLTVKEVRQPENETFKVDASHLDFWRHLVDGGKIAWTDCSGGKEAVTTIDLEFLRGDASQIIFYDIRYMRMLPKEDA
jgi:hypothetical protein